MCVLFLQYVAGDAQSDPLRAGSDRRGGGASWGFFDSPSESYAAG